MTGPYTPPNPLGWQPIKITPIFSLGQDWIATLLRADAEPWPTGTLFTAAVGQFSVDGAASPDGSVTFKLPAAQADLVAAGAEVRILVTYPDSPDTDTYVWAQGKARRND